MFNKHFNMHWNKQFFCQVLHFNILTVFVVAKQHQLGRKGESNIDPELSAL